MFGSSQGFGYGEVAASAPEAPKRVRQEDKQTCIPVTIRVLQDAVARHADSQEVLIHGVEASIVHIVGVIEGLVQQPAMIEFQLNDASGRMKVRYYVSSNGSMEGLSGLTNGSYISVVGNLRTSPSAHVSAMCLQAVASADEVSYHMIEVAHAALRLRNPSTRPTSTGLSVGAADPITPAKQLGLGSGVAGTVLSPVKVQDVPLAGSAVSASMQTPPKADLRSVVVDVLRQAQESAGEEGLNLSAVLARLPGAQVSSSEKVKDVLSQLVDEGEVFTTIDDDHFAII